MLGELNREQIEHLLHSEIVGRIGCHAEGRTYVVPVNYVYDGAFIYGHSAEGMKLRMLRANPEVCFEVDHRASLADWQSVITWGTFEELHGTAAEQAMDLLLNRFLPMLARTDHHSSVEATLRRPSNDTPAPNLCIYRIRLRERTGRFERHEA